MADIAGSLREGVRPVLTLIDDLRKIGIQQAGIGIPQIAVMGDQSSGKSSVLEAISGIPFPRGAGLVTRCATQLTMSRGDQWCATLRAGKMTRVADDKEAIAGMIEEMTEFLCGDGTFCSEESIEVQLEAPDAPDLTIIDLPGIVRTVTEGQDPTVIEQVNQLIQKYLVMPRTIILAVIASNVDIATNEIIERASRVDPEGKRTMGVLTKPDLVDAGAESEVIAVLDNITKPLHHGYVMLKNRAQKDLDSGMTLTQARAAELEYFEASEYKGSDRRLGVGALTSVLTDLLVSQIKLSLPDILTEINLALKSAENELLGMGAAPPSTAGERLMAAQDILRSWGSAMLELTQQHHQMMQYDIGMRVLQRENTARKEFADNVLWTMPGFDGQEDKYMVKVTETDDDPGDEGLEEGVEHHDCGSAVQVSKVCLKVDQEEYLTEDEDVEAEYYKCGFTEAVVTEVVYCFRSELSERLRTERGRELSGFLNFNLFKMLMAEYTSRWEEPTENFRKVISEALTQAAASLMDKYADQMPVLGAKLKSEIMLYMSSADKEATLRLKILAKQELMPCTENHYLYDTINKTRNDRIKEMVNELSTYPHDASYVSKTELLAIISSDVGNESNESQEVQDMIDILSSYWKLAAKRYIDEASMLITDAYTKPGQIDQIECTLRNALLGLPDSELEQLFVPNERQELRRRQLTSVCEKMSRAKACMANAHYVA